MPTNFPVTSIDAFTNPNATDLMTSPAHHTQHTNENDAIVALETKVGVDSSAVTTTHDYKLSGVTGSDKAMSKTGTETAANKTLTAPKINIGSDATGDMYYRDSGGSFQRLALGSAGQIINADATGVPLWISNPAAADASTTVKGVVEQATVAEVDTRTSTGGTTAPLFMTPSALTNIIPAGGIQMYGGSSAPTGWLLCDGTSYLQATYPGLFTVISTTYGSADGTHFNVPDMRGRIPIGVGTGTGGGATGTGLPTGGSALTALARAQWKGEETHVLITAELASHNHTINGEQSVAGAGSIVGFGATSGGTARSTTTAGSGSDTAHNNIQPVMGVNFIIKT